MLRAVAFTIGVSLPLHAAEVRIGVLSLFQPQTLVVRAPAEKALRVVAGNASRDLEPGGRLELRASGAAVAFGGAAEGGQASLITMSARDGGPASFFLSVPKRIERRYEGVLTVRSVNGRLQAVVACDLETAVAASVAAETSPGTPLEALKAQAIAVRSYYLAVRGAHSGFDFCDTTHCQFFGSPPAPGSAAARATRETAGIVVSWRGQVLAARYCAACGGRTRSLRDVGEQPRNYPFYAVDCQPCLDHEPLWESRLNREEASPLLNSPGSEGLRMQIIRRLGFGALPGNNYTVAAQEGLLIIRGRGRGHGVGLCQRGATAFAAAGKSFREILARYFPGTDLISRAAGR